MDQRVGFDLVVHPCPSILQGKIRKGGEQGIGLLNRLLGMPNQIAHLVRFPVSLAFYVNPTCEVFGYYQPV